MPNKRDLVYADGPNADNPVDKDLLKTKRKIKKSTYVFEKDGTKRRICTHESYLNSKKFYFNNKNFTPVPLEQIENIEPIDDELFLNGKKVINFNQYKALQKKGHVPQKPKKVIPKRHEYVFAEGENEGNPVPQDLLDNRIPGTSYIKSGEDGKNIKVCTYRHYLKLTTNVEYRGEVMSRCTYENRIKREKESKNPKKLDDDDSDYQTELKRGSSKQSEKLVKPSREKPQNNTPSRIEELNEQIEELDEQVLNEKNKRPRENSNKRLQKSQGKSSEKLTEKRAKVNKRKLDDDFDYQLESKPRKRRRSNLSEKLVDPGENVEGIRERQRVVQRIQQLAPQGLNPQLSQTSQQPQQSLSLSNIQQSMQNNSNLENQSTPNKNQKTNQSREQQLSQLQQTINTITTTVASEKIPTNSNITPQKTLANGRVTEKDYQQPATNEEEIASSKTRQRKRKNVIVVPQKQNNKKRKRTREFNVTQSRKKRKVLDKNTISDFESQQLTPEDASSQKTVLQDYQQLLREPGLQQSQFEGLQHQQDLLSQIPTELNDKDQSPVKTPTNHRAENNQQFQLLKQNVANQQLPQEPIINKITSTTTEISTTNNLSITPQQIQPIEEESNDAGDFLPSLNSEYNSNASVDLNILDDEVQDLVIENLFLDEDETSTNNLTSQQQTIEHFPFSLIEEFSTDNLYNEFDYLDFHSEFEYYPETPFNQQLQQPQQSVAQQEESHQDPKQQFQDMQNAVIPNQYQNQLQHQSEPNLQQQQEPEPVFMPPIRLTSGISLAEKNNNLRDNFKFALSSYNNHITKDAWNKSPLLQNWYSGKEVNFGNNHLGQPDNRVIPLDDLISNFKAALSSQRSYVIKAMWNGNPLLRNWYSGKEVNFGYNHLGQPDNRTITLDDLNGIFKSALSSRCLEVIKAMWDGSPLLQNWFSGKQVNFGNNHLGPDNRAISLDDLISNFKSALSSQCIDVIKAMWGGNPLLRDWYSGKQVNFGNNHLGPDNRAIPFEELVSNFKSALTSRCMDVIKVMWDGNPLLRNWYSGHVVNFGNLDKPDNRTIPLDDLISNFKAALSSQRSYVIKAMWNGNPLLRNWYSGKEVNFGNLDQPDNRSIPPDELISNFKPALSSHCIDVIKDMWNGNRLGNAVNRLSFEDSKKLLKKVMRSSTQGISDFITQYVNTLDNVDLIGVVLKDIQISSKNKNLSTYKKKQISLLTNRLDELNKATNHAHDITVEISNETNANSNIIAPVPTQTIPAQNILEEERDLDLTDDDFNLDWLFSDYQPMASKSNELTSQLQSADNQPFVDIQHSNSPDKTTENEEDTLAAEVDEWEEFTTQQQPNHNEMSNPSRDIEDLWLDFNEKSYWDNNSLFFSQKEQQEKQTTPTQQLAQQKQSNKGTV